VFWAINDIGKQRNDIPNLGVSTDRYTSFHIDHGGNILQAILQELVDLRHPDYNFLNP